MRISKKLWLICVLWFMCIGWNLPATAQANYAFNTLQVINNKSSQKNSAQKEKLIVVLRKLNKEKGAYFMFSDQKLGQTPVYKIQDMTPATEVILNHILDNSGLTYKKINNNTFVIVEEQKPDVKLEFPESRKQLVNFSVFAYVPLNVIKGTVTGKDGLPLAGASISIKGKKGGTSTDANGHFTIEAAPGDVLVITYLGYGMREVTVGNEENIAIQLSEESTQLSAVVVTALGIERKSKSLSYATQKVDNEDLTNVKNGNIVNNLSGRVAGLNVTRSSSGLGGSVRVVIRGNKSTRENQPLYVIDGVPMSNPNPGQPSDEWGQTLGFVGLDGGDGIGNLNPDDIENITVLKGASAAALYGSQAANGVILITTKKGHRGDTRVNVSTEWFFDKPMYEQPLQFKYGQTVKPSAGNPGSTDSWGSIVNAPDHVAPFFQTGVTSFNSLSITGGTEKSQTYFSYSYADNKGVIPTASLNKHNFNLHQTTNFFNGRLVADGNALYIHEKSHNRPVSGLYNNPLTGLYGFPRGLNFENYKNHYQVFSTARNTEVQNWWNANYDSAQIYNGGFTANETDQNPYWLINRVTSDNVIDRIYTNFSLKYKLTDWLDVQARGNIDKSVNDINVKSSATTSPVLTGNNGAYTYLRAVNTQLYGDLLFSGRGHISDQLSINGTIGTSINDGVNDQNTFGTKNSGDGLRFANVFTLANILPGALLVSSGYTHKQVQAVFATAQLNWKDGLYVDLTGRNDWSSTFAYTPVENKGYFYYSGGISAVLSDLMKIGGPVSFSKVRASYAKVGNDVPVYATNPVAYSINNQDGSVTNTKGPKPGTYLKPEDNRSFEAGTEWRFLSDKIGFDFTYYINNNYNQYIEIPVTPGSTGNYSTWYVNSGNIRNNGIELSIFATPVQTKTIQWNTTLNYAMNKNKVVKIADEDLGVEQDYFTITGIGNLLYASYIKEGGSWGDIYGHFFKRDANGAIVVDDNGAPLLGQDDQSTLGDQSLKRLGNPNPDFTLGWNNTLRIKNLSVNFLFDGRFGGEVMSMTQAVLDGMGVSKETAKARDAGGVKINAVKQNGDKFAGPIDPQTFYTTVGGRSGIGEYYMYDATNIRLRELSFAYKIPLKTNVVKNLTVSLIGRNLFFVTRKAPFDPETSMGTYNGLQGIETYSVPTTRSMGISVKLGF